MESQSQDRPQLTFQKAKERALRLLAIRDHSALELRKKLKHKLQINEELWQQILTSLKELGYMAPEKDLSERWINQWRQEGRGRRWIAGKLKEKGLPVPSMNDDEDEIQAAMQFSERKCRNTEFTLSNLKGKAKLNRALMSRGFSGYVISHVLKRRTSP